MYLNISCLLILIEFLIEFLMNFDRRNLLGINRNYLCRPSYKKRIQGLFDGTYLTPYLIFLWYFSTFPIIIKKADGCIILLQYLCLMSTKSQVFKISIRYKIDLLNLQNLIHSISVLFFSKYKPVQKIASMLCCVGRLIIENHRTKQSYIFFFPMSGINFKFLIKG